ncbi:uncharacterized protein K452DRAFT_322568 [Aplosporella prunicola CBS 121167]|uniref:Cytochrome P450 n=1 Tax=Aplosporella prunicola CBS 121167 TaxID=1176127 RepID=A0A6A6AZ22_9PEZI|nr:uncharacterized protein K452DRAFT_322568 [Aplosporella prunicola CBS 121167]KAF2136205.1 hypothetical protein K452DRAFT_322568 [Aplosporella prunicola CBS 121167]
MSQVLTESVLTVSPFAWFGLLVLTWLVYGIAYDLFLSPLSRFPGPRLWAISRIPSQLSIVRGHHHLDVLALHDKYGPVVRIGPAELAFNTAEAFRDIYGPRPEHERCVKERSHYGPQINGADHLSTAVDDAVHSRQRRLLSHAFSERALKEQEPLVTRYVDTLISRLREHITAAPTAALDIKAWFNYTTFDITGDLMFGESFNCLQDRELHPWIKLIFNSLKAMSLQNAVNQFPFWSALLGHCIPKRVRQGELDHFNLSAAKVDRRLKLGSERPDFISAMLKNGLTEGKGDYRNGKLVMSRAEIHSNAFLLIVGGSETSATLLSGCIYYLCQNRAILNRLSTEIRTAFPTNAAISFTTSAQLPYLAAVIQESLRMYPPLVTSLARITPLSGTTICGTRIPGNTIVAGHHYATYHSGSNFALPHRFAPERWLDSPDANPIFAADHRDALQPFSLGPRNCIGKNLAYAEIRLILCKLLWNFNVHMDAESEHWTDQEAHFVWDKPALMVRLEERPAKDVATMGA